MNIQLSEIEGSFTCSSNADVLDWKLVSIFPCCLFSLMIPKGLILENSWPPFSSLLLVVNVVVLLLADDLASTTEADSRIRGD